MLFGYSFSVGYGFVDIRKKNNSRQRVFNASKPLPKAPLSKDVDNCKSSSLSDNVFVKLYHKMEELYQKKAKTQ
jgi:hypothetical protein